MSSRASDDANGRQPGGRWRSIGVRLTAWYFGVFIISTLLLAAGASLSIRSSVRSQANQTITAELALQRQVFLTEGIEGLRRRVAVPAAAPLYMRVLDREHGTLFEYRSSPEVSFAAPSSDELLAATPSVHTVRARADGSTWNLGSVAISNRIKLELARSDAPTQEVFGHLRAALLVVWLGAVALGLLGGFYLTGRALQPIERLTAAARRVIDSGDLALRVPVRNSGDELDQMTRLFNGVLARNEALVRGMREALDNVAHDLRTPLTRLRTGAEMALRDATDSAQLRDALADGIEESERVLAMLSTLMDISEAETGVMKLKAETVELSQLAEQVIDIYEHVAAERGLRIVTHLEPAVSVRGDPNRLHQALANLVDNAIKYTPAGGQVELLTFREGEWSCAAVKDTGIGIADEDLPRIWQRLYRADRSRSERGLGLGLSFVKAIVAAHGGVVNVTSAPGAGSTFTMKLPAGACFSGASRSG